MTAVILIAVAAAQSDKKTQVKINYLNVCTPSVEEQKELSGALARIPAHPRFSEDFEVSRGRTSLTEPPIKLAGVETEEAPAAAGGTSKWVRVRREFAADSPFVSVQYSVSVDQKNIVETLVFRSREAKDVIQISLEDSVSASSDPLQVLKVDTPVDRVRIERFGKSSVVLTRCPSADQKTYQPLFDQGSSVLAHYRGILGVQQIVPADLKRLGVGASAKAAGKR
ncbi:MAG: hypothetical protein DMG66_04700 [Acidobacteria bacterium]|nr:MAG: hypothetical protein DMG66_04700 [Acidobacteriota bacterium]